MFHRKASTQKRRFQFARAVGSRSSDLNFANGLGGCPEPRAFEKSSRFLAGLNRIGAREREMNVCDDHNVRSHCVITIRVLLNRDCRLKIREHKLKGIMFNGTPKSCRQSERSIVAVDRSPDLPVPNVQNRRYRARGTVGTAMKMELNEQKAAR